MLYTRYVLVGLAGAVAVGGLLLASDVLSTALGQVVVDAQDPPSRVGRVARLSGIVSFRSSDQVPWDTAALNYPITSGNALWTEPAAIVEIDIDSEHLVLDQSSEFDIGTLDDQTMVATVVQGTLYLRLGPVQSGDSHQIATPRGVVTITKAGRYEIVAGDTVRPTELTVVEGSADMDIGSTSLTVTPRQTAQVTGADDFRASIAPATNDPFLTARLASERSSPLAVTRSVAPPLEVAQMTGGDALVTTGTWALTLQYGLIWYPPVDAEWVPYRHGHWRYVAPWGWTWIDDAPWGFAPFHYGRWVEDGRRWGWVPVQQGVAAAAVRPTYAPALVSFIGLTADAAIRGNSVGWIPLGPQEVYRPPYAASTRYVREVNLTNVREVTNVKMTTESVTINRYVNRRAVSVVPVAVITDSQPVAPRVEQVTPQTIALARLVQGAPVAPTTATIGVTPVVAEALNIKSEAGALKRPITPGPAQDPRAGGVQFMSHIAVAVPAGATTSPDPHLPYDAEWAAAPGRQFTAQPITLPRLRAVPAAVDTTKPVQPAFPESKSVPPRSAAPMKPGTSVPIKTPARPSQPKQPATALAAVAASAGLSP